MTDWSDWEVLRRQVVVAGWILDAEGERLSGANLSVVRAVGQGADDLGSEGAEGRSISAHIKSDGLYFLTNLPDGRYKLKGYGAQGAATKEKTIRVRWQSNEKPDLQSIDLELSSRPNGDEL